MTPVSFGECLGALHDAGGDTAIIMCGAPGFEQLCAQKGWRELAELFASRGFPTLRFDWLGCGDSLGGDEDPARVDAWRASLEQAIFFARAHLAPRHVVLVGLRLGATIAADVAARSGGIDGLVLLGPAISGRLYGRELAGLAKVMAPLSPDATMDGLSVAGFRTTNETLESMKAIDLRKLSSPPAPRAIVFSPESQMGADDTIAHWRALGCDATLEPFDGYAAWLAEPTFSEIPRATFERAADWIATQFPPTPKQAPATPNPPAHIDGDCFSETPIQFGEASALNGVLCEPVGRARAETVAIFVNAGANPRVGWARMNVDGARKLAADGFASLRMDVAGLGDSPPAPGRNPQVMYDVATRADVGAAIDALQRQGFSRFMVIGLCSGAHTAFHSAVADDRIAGVVMVNLQKFIWRDDYSLALAVRQAYRSTGSYQRGALRLETYKRLLRGEIDATGIAREMARRIGRLAVAKIHAVSRLLREGDDETSRVRRWFRQLSARGARVLLVYSVDDGGIDELAIHFGAGGKRLRGLPGIEIAMIENADHNLTQRAARTTLFGLIEGFMGLHAAPDVQRIAPPEAIISSAPCLSAPLD
jgi:pimeloyl-ACP methyl ester carboxylesterase